MALSLSMLLSHKLRGPELSPLLRHTTTNVHIRFVFVHYAVEDLWCVFLCL